MTDDAVPIWCFAGRNVLALTDDESGGKLPPDLGPWTLARKIMMTGSDADEVEALGLIRAYGFCCFDPAPVEPEA